MALATRSRGAGVGGAASHGTSYTVNVRGAGVGGAASHGARYTVKAGGCQQVWVCMRNKTGPKSRENATVGVRLLEGH